MPRPSPLLVLLAVLAYLALVSSISWFPLSLFLASLLAYASSTEWEAAWPPSIVTAIPALMLGETLARIGPGIQALSTPVISILVLLLTSGMHAFIFLIPILIFVSSAPHIGSPMAKIALFPALWATTIKFVSHSSPVGRVGVWSPIYGMECYRWLLPYFGNIVHDWIVGVSVVLVLQIAEQAHWCPPFLFTDRSHSVTLDPNNQPTSPLEWPNDAITQADVAHSPVTSDVRSKEHNTSWRNLPVRSETIFTAALLAILAAPAIVYPNLVHTYPESPKGTDVTSLNVACIMPTLAPSTSPKSILDTYLAESARYGSLARIHLWPESAVRFDTGKERTEYIEALGKLAATYGIWIGVGFDDFAPHDSKVREGMRRNGLVLVGPQGVEFEYLKQNLVPITESFSIVPSSDPPPFRVVNIPYGTSGKHKVTRPIVLTAAICLDLAHSSTLAQLPGRADLILAPGKTWDVRVGQVMHQQAALRADEVGSLALWCDAGGLSGVVGRGESGVQNGRGSFVRNLGIPFADGETNEKTFYASTGDIFSLVLVWVPLLTTLGVQWSLQNAEGDTQQVESLQTRLMTQARTAYGKALRSLKGLTAPANSTENLIEV